MSGVQVPSVTPPNVEGPGGSPPGPSTLSAQAGGNMPIRPWYSLPSWSVSDPTSRPLDVDTSAFTPTPRLRVGFHDSARPVLGSTAAIPGRLTAPGPADSWPSGLSIQRWWPPT